MSISMITMMALCDGFPIMGVNSDWSPEKARVISSGVMATAWYNSRLCYACDGWLATCVGL